MQKGRRAEAFFLCCCIVVPLVVLELSKDAGRFHGTTALWAQETLDLKPALEGKAAAVVADPVLLWNFVDSIALLVDGDVAATAEDYEVFVFVVAIVANCTLSVVLHGETTLVSRQLRVARVLCQVSLVFATVLQLLQNELVIHVVLLLLPEFNMAEEFFFSAGRIVYVQEDL